MVGQRSQGLEVEEAERCDLQIQGVVEGAEVAKIQSPALEEGVGGSLEGHQRCRLCARVEEVEEDCPWVEEAGGNCLADALWEH